MEESIYLVKSPTLNYQDVFFSFCGYAKTANDHRFGPAIRDVYLIHIITAGEGYYSVNNTKYYFKKGEGFIIPPKLSTFYQASSENPWHYVWMGIGGKQVKTYFDSLGVNEQHLSFRVRNPTDFKVIVFEAFAYEEDSLINELSLQKQAYTFLQTLYDAIELHTNRVVTKRMDHHVSQALTMITQNSMSQLSIKKIAEELAIHTSHLSRLFKKEIGISIKDYVTEIRISASNDLLATTDYTIQQISEISGFANIQTFSKSFKKHNKVSPSIYRKQRIGIGGEITPYQI